jgi:hypothetical protein
MTLKHFAYAAIFSRKDIKCTLRKSYSHCPYEGMGFPHAKAFLKKKQTNKQEEIYADEKDENIRE